MAIQRNPAPQQGAMITTPAPAQHHVTPLAAHLPTVTAAPMPPGLEFDLGAQIDVPVPWISIAMGDNIAAAGLQRGLWTHRSTGEQKPTITIAACGIIRQRTMLAKYSPNATEQPPPICASLLGVAGLGSATFDGEHLPPRGTNLDNDDLHKGAFAIEPGRVCESCAWAQWQDGGAGGKRIKPACTESYALVAYEEEWGPVVLRFKRTAIPAWRAFYPAWSTTALRGWRQLAPQNPAAAAALGRDAGPLACTFTVGSAPVNNYHVPTFTGRRITAAEEYAMLAEEYGALAAIRERITTRLEDAHQTETPGASAADDGFEPGAA